MRGKLLSPVTYGTGLILRFFFAVRIRNVQFAVVSTANVRRMLTAIRACAK